MPQKRAARKITVNVFQYLGPKKVSKFFNYNGLNYQNDTKKEILIFILVFYIRLNRYFIQK